jgi:outer membrane protein insertion porin family
MRIVHLFKASLGLSIPALLCIANAFGLPQAATPAIAAIRVHGQKRYTAEQIIAASGVKAGQAFSNKMLNDATNRLGDTGAFASVRYNYKVEGGKLVIEFIVEEAEKFHACTFDNQIWFTDQELLQAIRKRVPLFDGYAPEVPNMMDEIGVAFEAAVNEKGIPGKVERSIYGALGDPHWQHLYKILGVHIKVTGVSFEGTKNLSSSILDKEAGPLIGRNYSLAGFRLFGQSTFIPLYRQYGYLQARLSDVRVKESNRDEETQNYQVQVIYPVAEGIQYNWNPPTWSGETVFTPESLEKLVGLKQGEVANGTKIEEGWEAVKREYGRKGYIELKLEDEPVFDDANHSVTYHVGLTEGYQFRMGSALFEGFPPGVLDSLKKRWKLKPGDVFDGGYLKEFVKTDFRDVLQNARLPVKGIKMQQKADQEHKTMDVIIRGE